MYNYNRIELQKGDRFCRLTVVEYSHTEKGHRKWLCKCDCGNKILVSASNLVATGKYQQKSCGCLKREKASERMSSTLQTPECRVKSGLARRKPDSAFREVLGRYKKSARLRKLEFLLTNDEFKRLTQSFCFYCGEKPNKIFKTTNDVEQYIYNGIDRKDNSIGYVLSNSLPCCWLCNKIKGDISFEDFTTQVKRIALWQVKL